MQHVTLDSEAPRFIHFDSVLLQQAANNILSVTGSHGIESWTAENTNWPEDWKGHTLGFRNLKDAKAALRCFRTFRF